MSDDELFASLAAARFVVLVDESELERRRLHTARRIRREARREALNGIRRWQPGRCCTVSRPSMKPIPDPVDQCVLPDGALAVVPVRQCADIGLPKSSLEPLSRD